ncbi:MAG: BrnT family toxin [Elusimicrobia bacterium]|nr:BrnT family toxin [Elusimicrobiota bacterium]
MDYYTWDPEKNARLKAERGISFEQIVLHIERGDVLGLYEHPNQARYPNQRVLVVKVDNYAFLVPFVESEEGRFLKTIIPSRKATRDLLGGPDEKD